jgi:NAD(P)-dependent dehydrogenase (short-subunit alcohol dehydrogenase family)
MVKRIFITGAARGLGKELAKRLVLKGHKVFLSGIELDLLKETASEIGDVAFCECDVRVLEQVSDALEKANSALGGLDVIVANAGTAVQLPIAGGDPELFYKTIEVNLFGCFNTVHAGAKYVSHPKGYVLMISSLAAAIHLPLMSAYSASKAAVEALGNTLRVELAPSGAKVGVAYFSEIDTDMTKRGFATQAAKVLTGGGSLTKPAPVKVAIDALEEGIKKRKRRIVAPFWVEYLLHIRGIAQHLVELGSRARIEKALEIAVKEKVEFTTPQKDLKNHSRS